MKRCALIILFILDVTFAIPVSLNSAMFAIANSHMDDSVDQIEDSLENVAEKIESSKDSADDREDRVQDSIQEKKVGPEGRTLRLSYCMTLTKEDQRYFYLPGLALTNRFDFVEIGLNECAFYESNLNSNRFYLTLSPSIGFVPFLTRPFRFSGGIGSTLQFAFNNSDTYSFTPFMYISGTYFYVKRVSSTITLRGRHTSKGNFVYLSKHYHHFRQDHSWIDFSMSVDFYF